MLTGIAAVAFVCFAAMTLMPAMQEMGDGNVYSISYSIQDDVTLSNDCPDSYTSGVKTDMGIAYRDGFAFQGWFYNDDLTLKCAYIETGHIGDVTLYPKWGPVYENNGMTFNVSGYDVRGRIICYDVTGVMNIEYVKYNPDTLQTLINVSYYMSYGDYVISDRYSIWSDMDNNNYDVDRGTEITLADGSTVTCDILTMVTDDSTSNTKTEKYYIDPSGWPVYRVEIENANYGNTTEKIVLDCTGTYGINVDDAYNVTAVGEMGISTDGSNRYDVGSVVTLTAAAEDGYDFAGWFDEEGEFLSSDASYSFILSNDDVAVYACNTREYDLKYGAGYNIQLNVSDEQSDTYYISDDTGSVLYLTDSTATYTFSNTGTYFLTHMFIQDGIVMGESTTFFIDGTSAHVYEWYYDGRSYTTTLDIAYDDYLGYGNMKSPDDRKASLLHTHDTDFVTYSDKYIVELANYFEGLQNSNGWTDLETTNAVLRFVQYLPYQTDVEYYGYNDYWKFPVETLYDGGGDCEDTTFLYCAIVKAMGYNCAILTLSDHVAACISVDGATGVSFSKGGVSYYYCESTGIGYGIGEVPDSIDASNPYYRTLSVV